MAVFIFTTLIIIIFYFTYYNYYNYSLIWNVLWENGSCGFIYIDM